MTLFEALSVLSEYRTNEIVVTAMGAVRDWGRVSEHPLDFHYLPSSMGQASALALGLALAQPEREVWVFTGDGCLLMNLGVVATIGHHAPANLLHFVVNNGVYEMTGRQPIPGHGRVDFAALAKACAWPTAVRWQSVTDIRKGMAGLVQAPHPAMIDLVTESNPDDLPPRSPGPMRQAVRAFKAHLTPR